MIGQVKSTMTIRKGNTGHVPKGEQEAQLLEIHIPRPTLIKSDLGPLVSFELTSS